MHVSATVNSQANQHEVSVATNQVIKTLVIAPKAGSFGSSVNGAELLLLSLATCYCNDIYREAAKRNISITGVSVEVTGEFGAEGEPGRNFKYRPLIQSTASEDAIAELILFTDSVAEIHKTLRSGIEVRLEK